MIYMIQSLKETYCKSSLSCKCKNNNIKECLMQCHFSGYAFPPIIHFLDLLLCNQLEHKDQSRSERLSDGKF